MKVRTICGSEWVTCPLLQMVLTKQGLYETAFIFIHFDFNAGGFR